MFFPYLALISSSRISVPRPHLEGSLWPNGQPSNRYGRQQSPIVHSCRRPSVATSVSTTTMTPKYSSPPSLRISSISQICSAVPSHACSSPTTTAIMGRFARYRSPPRIIAHHRSPPRLVSIFVCNFAIANLNKTPL